MSNHTTFPDAIVFPDGTIRLVTDAAKQWAYTNTAINGWCTISTVPDYVDFDKSIPPLMEGKGLVVQWKRMPVSHLVGIGLGTTGRCRSVMKSAGRQRRKNRSISECLLSPIADI